MLHDMNDDDLLTVESTVIDKDHLVLFLSNLENGAINFAFGQKSDVAVKAYAQAAAYKYILDHAISGEFDLVPTGTIFN